MTEPAPDDSPRLSPSLRPAVLATLEECTDTLAIFQYSLENRLKRTDRISAGCALPDIEELDLHDPELSPDGKRTLREIREEAACMQLREESLYVKRIVERLKEEIRNHGTFGVLTREIERIIAIGREKEAALKEAERARKVAEELQRKIAEERIANEREKRRLLYESAEAQRQRAKLKLIADAESRYVDAWEKAKREQYARRLDIELQELEKRLRDYRIREKNEKRVHDELTTFLTQQIEFIGGKIAEWRERHDREKGTYEKQIRNTRDEIEARRKELQRLREEYRVKQEFIDAYLAEKEARRRLKEQEEHTRRSAIRIQAWWRGVMVRRKLGPYRPEEKKKKRPGTKTQK